MSRKRDHHVITVTISTALGGVTRSEARATVEEMVADRLEELGPQRSVLPFQLDAIEIESMTQRQMDERIGRG